MGVITRLPGDKHVFALDENYVEDEERPVLNLSLKGESVGVVTAIIAVWRRVPPFFSNVHREGHLRTYLAGQAGVNPEREFFLLAVLGPDLSGAVVVDAGGRLRPGRR